MRKQRAIIPLLVDESYPDWPLKWIEGEPGASKLRHFKDYLLQELTVPDGYRFKRPDDIGQLLGNALAATILELTTKKDHRIARILCELREGRRTEMNAPPKIGKPARPQELPGFVYNSDHPASPLGVAWPIDPSNFATSRELAMKMSSQRSAGESFYISYHGQVLRVLHIKAAQDIHGSFPISVGAGRIVVERHQLSKPVFCPGNTLRSLQSGMKLFTTTLIQPASVEIHEVVEFSLQALRLTQIESFASNAKPLAWACELESVEGVILLPGAPLVNEDSQVLGLIDVVKGSISYGALFEREYLY